MFATYSRIIPACLWCEEVTYINDYFKNLLITAAPDDNFLLLFNWLDGTDFFTAPASTNYHDNEPGGLVKHVIKVYETFVEKNDRYKLGLTPRQMAVCGLLHDICKVNVYKKETKNKKINGVWNEVQEWVFSDKFPLGHGEKSALVLQEFIKLDPLELFVIRWHMGPFTDGFESFGVNKSFNAAVELYPAIAAFFTADYEASHFN